MEYHATIKKNVVDQTYIEVSAYRSGKGIR